MRTAWLPLVLLVACKGSSLASADGELSLPVTVELGQLYVSFASSVAVPVSFSGAAGCDVELVASAPFTVTPHARVEKGSPVNVTVSVTPAAQGILDGTVVASGCGHSATARMSGQAALPPDCGGGGACTVSRFDPDAGGCTTSPVDEGTPCTDACLTAPRCHGGDCVGTALDCDDSDPCTLDTCSPTAGCQHFDATRFCPPLPSCGAQCDGGDCGTLKEVWSTPPQASAVIDPTLADSAGNVYWLEEDAQSSFQGWLVSMSRTGALRYRVAVDLVNASPQPMLVGGAVLFSRWGGRWVSAYRASDGAFLWKRDLHDDLEQAGHPELVGKLIYVTRGTVGAAGEAVFPVAFWDNTDFNAYFFVALDPATGATRWRQTLVYDQWEVQSDEDGGLYSSVRYSYPTHLAAFDRAGTPLWTSTHQPGPAYRGSLYSSDVILDAATGQPVFSFTPEWLPADVVTPTMALRREPHSAYFEFFDPATGQVRGTWHQLQFPEFDMIVTGPDELLAVGRGNGARLFGFGADGSERFSCGIEVPAQTLLFSSSTLVPGLLLEWWQDPNRQYTLHAYALPGRSEAAQGWVSSYGQMARTLRPK